MAYSHEHWLIIQEPGATRQRKILLDKAEYSIGRSSKNSIVIKHPSVSASHAQIVKQGKGWWVADLNSSNGTFVNETQVEKIHQLSAGDSIRIGKVIAVFQQESVAKPQQAAAQTIHFNSLDHLTNLPDFTIGRSRSQNKLPLDHPLVSRWHAEIKKTERGHLLRDLHSTNGTFVNGQPVRGKQNLRDGDEIRIGPFKLVYSHSTFTQALPPQRPGFTGFGYRIDAIDLFREVPDTTPKAKRETERFKSPRSKHPGMRTILDDVKLSVLPGEFIALVGGSGAGKSTLMKALSGFVPAQSGKVLVNGDDFYTNFSNYRSIIGYVPQDDIVHQQLTAHSALRYAAQLRLPDDSEADFIAERIRQSLELVEMTEHADKPIHTLSGGQRKRVSIAVELLSEPKLFFLDEPTSGLDPGLEKKMMHTLRQRAEQDGRTIVLVTHATENIGQCTHVSFMAEGCMVYFGEPKDAREHFKTKNFSDIYTYIANSDVDDLVAEFKESDDYGTYIAQRQTDCHVNSQPVETSRQKIRRKASSLRQFGVLTKRYFELICRDKTSLLTLLLVMPLIGLLLLIMAHPDSVKGKTRGQIRQEIHEELEKEKADQKPEIDDEQFSGSYTVVGTAQKLLFMFALSANLLGIFAAAYEIIKERPIYLRERMVNLKIPPYLLSKIVVLTGFAIFQCPLLLAVVGIRLKYPSDGVFAPALFEMYVTLLLSALASICLGLFISAIVRSQNTVLYVILLVLFIQIIFAGAIFKLPDVAKPISYLTTTRWTLEALGSTIDMHALNDLGVSCVEIENKRAGASKAPCKTDQLKQSIDFDFHIDYEHTQAHLFSRWLVLFGFAIVFTGLTALTQKLNDTRH